MPPRIQRSNFLTDVIRTPQFLDQARASIGEPNRHRTLSDLIFQNLRRRQTNDAALAPAAAPPAAPIGLTLPGFNLPAPGGGGEFGEALQGGASPTEAFQRSMEARQKRAGEILQLLRALFGG